ncbi:MAG: T9SS type A sorting domain-containing protein [Saprospiraceae bacterium]|nr:T9SS type A sorting domain-containing protein [Saprospiraceae bacterium]
MKNLRIIGNTQNAGDVEILGLGWNNSNVTHIFNVAADSFTLANMTIGAVFYHPVQVHSHPNDADFFHVRNVRFIDAKEQLLKVSGGSTTYADKGIVECCTFEFTAGIAFQDYTGGIDAHQSKDWIVRDNIFKNIKSPNSTLAEHAIHFWRRSTNTWVERNVIINCDRGIGFGLGDDPLNGHPEGLICNNFVHTSTDVGIGLEYAPNVKIYNNTVITENYSNAIEYRFAGTSNVHVANNLTKGIITDRSSGSSGTIESNVEISTLHMFADSTNHDYHLTGQFTGIVDAGISLVEIISDVDCEIRPVNDVIDIGADEYSMQTTSSDVVLDPSNILLYPNPVENKFTISGTVNDYTVEVLDQTGQVYMAFNQSSGNITVDLSTLPAGLYFVKVENKQNQLLCIKLILKT